MGKNIGRKSTVLIALPLVLLCLSCLLPPAMQHAKADFPVLVRNVNTDLDYFSIQEAIDAPQTLDGHTLSVNPGVFTEHLVVHKSLTIVGSGAEATVVDGDGIGTVVHITANDVLFSGFAVRNGGNSSVDLLNSGIFLNYCENVTLSNNKVTNCRYGVYLFHSSNSRLIGNNVSMNYEDGVWLYYSRNNVLERNTITSNKYNFGVFGQSFSDFDHTVDMSNTVDAKPIRYEIGLSNKVFDSTTEAATLYLVNAKNVTVRDLNLSGNGNGLFLWNATDCTVESVTASDNNYGIFLKESTGNAVCGNECPSNWVGIFLENSDQNSVRGNSAPYNEKGISLYGSNDNSLEGNTVSNNLYGIRFFASGSNKIAHTNFIENTEQIDLVNSYNNELDDGSEGNFWSDFAGQDANEDGIGDSPHNLSKGQDRYPLMGRFYEFPVASDGGEFRVPIVCNSLITSFNSGRTGDGDAMAISFNVTNEPGNPGFCRISIPTEFLGGPYVAKTYESTWVNATLRMLPHANETCSLLYFKYNSSVHSIAIVGVEPSPGEFPPAYGMLILVGVLIGTLLVLYFAAKKRTGEGKAYEMMHKSASTSRGFSFRRCCGPVPGK